MRRQKLDEPFSAPVACTFHTGKTFTFTKQLLRIPAQILAVMPTVTAGKESVAALHCAWTRCATTLMLERFCDEMNIADVQSGKLVIVFVGNAEDIHLTAHQKKCVTLWELKEEQQDFWCELWKKPARIHVFVTIGRSRMPATKYSAIRSWAKRFFMIHMEEASHVLQAFGIHILRFLRHDGKLILRGDTRQLPRFSHTQWRNLMLMRAVMAVSSRYLLDRQLGQMPGLGALTSGLLYEGIVSDAECLLAIDTTPFAVVVWDNVAPTAVESYFSETEPLIRMNLWKALRCQAASSGASNIMSFYKSQQRMFADRLPDRHHSVTVDPLIECQLPDSTDHANALVLAREVVQSLLLVKSYEHLLCKL